MLKEVLASRAPNATRSDQKAAWLQSIGMSLTKYVNIKLLPVFHNGMSSIVSTLRSAAQLNAVLCNDVDNFALPLVTPLRSENDCCHVCGVRESHV